MVALPLEALPLVVTGFVSPNTILLANSRTGWIGPDRGCARPGDGRGRRPWAAGTPARGAASAPRVNSSTVSNTRESQDECHKASKVAGMPAPHILVSSSTLPSTLMESGSLVVYCGAGRPGRSPLQRRAEVLVVGGRRGWGPRWAGHSCLDGSRINTSESSCTAPREAKAISRIWYQSCGAMVQPLNCGGQAGVGSPR